LSFAALTKRPIGFPVALLGVTLAAYVLVLAWLSPLVVQDNPNHLARAVVIGDLLFHHGRRYGQFFSFHFLATPNVLPDLVLATLTVVFGSTGASAVWAVVAFISLPFSLLVFLRAKRLPKDAMLLMLLLSAYFGTDAFFLMGFLPFRLSISLVFVVLALAELLRRRWSFGMLLGYWLMIGGAYLTHFAAIVFIGLFVGLSAIVRLARRTANVAREAYLLFPVACAVGWHLLVAQHYRRSSDLFTQTLDWGSAGTKIANLIWEITRYRQHTDLAIAAMLLVTVAVWRLAGGGAKDRPATEATPTASAAISRANSAEALVFVVGLLCFYLAMPNAYSEGGYVDVRALAFVPLFAVLGSLSWPSRSTSFLIRGGPLAAYLCAAALVLVNLLYLAKHLHADNLRMARYREVVEKIPEHARVLPVYTGGFEGIAQPLRNAASYAVIDRAALMPYLFSGEMGSPQTYFRYINRPYAPDDIWYVLQRGRDAGFPVPPDESPDVDWRRVSETYDYLLIWKPVEYSKIKAAGRVVAENNAAVLLSVTTRASD
jgi:hypothetical protein